jgi:hypothetical protein
MNVFRINLCQDGHNCLKLAVSNSRGLERLIKKSCVVFIWIVNDQVYRLQYVQDVSAPFQKISEIIKVSSRNNLNCNK